MIIIHCSQRRSCFDKLSTNGCPYPGKLFSVHPEPVEGRTVMDNPQLETVLDLVTASLPNLPSLTGESFHYHDLDVPVATQHVDPHVMLVAD